MQSLPMVDPDNIRSIVHVAKTRCAFVNFKDRTSAERAAEVWALGLDVNGHRAGVKWGRGKAAKGSASSNAAPPAAEVVAS